MGSGLDTNKDLNCVSLLSSSSPHLKDEACENELRFTILRRSNRGLCLIFEEDHYRGSSSLLNKVWGLEGCPLFLSAAYKSLSQV
jgi:hypothetical protein